MTAPRTRPSWGPPVAVAVLAAATVVVLALLAGASPYRALGSADPGVLVAAGTPLLRLATVLAATVCVGALAFAVFCTGPQPSGLVSADAYPHVQVAGRAAAAWCLGALLLVPFTEADTAAKPLSDVLAPDHLVGLLDALEGPKAWLTTAVVALVVAVGCRAALRWQPVLAMFLLAVVALLPPLVAGHGSSDVGHDLTLAAFVIHVPAAAIWAGLLLAVLRRARRGGPALPGIVRRYGSVANRCWLALAGSGLVLGAVLVAPDRLLTTGYGVVLLGKVVVTGALGVTGVALRRRVVRGLEAGPAGRRGLVRLGLAELTMLLGLVALSADLTHLPVPDFFGRTVSTAQMLLGYDLAGPPTAARLLTGWRIDVLFGPLAVLLAAGYLLRVRRLRAAGRPWPATRTAAWLGGCLVLLVATCSGLGRYAAAMFSVHMAAHMLVSMLVPALLVLGAPLTLLRSTLGPPGGAGRPLEWLVTASGSRAARLLTHPVVALVLFAGSPFALYLTGLFDAAVRFHWAHLAINAWFLAAGYLFLWPVIGADPAPRPLPNLARVGMLLAAMPADVVFGALLIGTGRVIGNGTAAGNFYQALALPWVGDLHADQRLAGILALVVGEVALLAVLAALVVRWSRVDAADDSGLAEYRSMLEKVGAGASPGPAGTENGER